MNYIMKAIKCLIISVCLSGGLSACDDFFDTVPNDQLSPATFWKTEADVINAVSGNKMFQLKQGIKELRERLKVEEDPDVIAGIKKEIMEIHTNEII